MDLSVRASAISTLGIFAERAFETGEIIHRLDGRALSLVRCAGRVLSGRLRVDDILQTARNRYVALDELSMRFNHSCEPNAAVRGDCDLVALAPIQAGSEITYDYALTVPPSLHARLRRLSCRCGTAGCRGTVGDLRTVPAARLRAHAAAGNLQDHIARRLARRHRRLVSESRQDPIPARLCPLPDAAAPRQPTDHSFVLRGGRTGVLLLHGLAGTPHEMRDVAVELQRAGCTVSCPQLHGHCGTYDDLKASRWQDWVLSAEAALLELRKSCDLVVVGGLSNGAIISLHLAAKAPRLVDAVVLLAPTLWLNGWMVPAHARLFRIVLQKPIANWFDFPDLPPHGIKDPQIRRRILDAMQSGDSSLAGLPVTPGGAMIEHRWLVQDVLKRIKSVRQPVLIVHAREDDYVDLNNVKRLLRRLPGMVEVMTLDDSYHIITADRQRHLVSERMAAFIDRLRRPSGGQRASDWAEAKRA